MENVVCKACGRIGCVELYADWLNLEFDWLCKCGKYIREATKEEIDEAMKR
jgi:hypothetical protein